MIRHDTPVASVRISGTFDLDSKRGDEVAAWAAQLIDALLAAAIQQKIHLDEHENNTLYDRRPQSGGYKTIQIPSPEELTAINSSVLSNHLKPIIRNKLEEIIKSYQLLKK